MTTFTKRRFASTMTAVIFAFSLAGCSPATSTQSEAASPTADNDGASAMVACLKAAGVQAGISNPGGLVEVYSPQLAESMQMDSNGDSTMVTSSPTEGEGKGPMAVTMNSETN